MKLLINDLQNIFFQFTSSWENCFLEKFKKTADVIFKKPWVFQKRYIRANQALINNKTITI